MPPRYTCDGDDCSPPLIWAGVPDGARSLALIVNDPDVPDPKQPTREWVHWILYNIPPDAPGLPEAVSNDELPPGTCQGLNDWGRAGYGGPSPPIGRHRYFHTLYALDRRLSGLGLATKASLLKAMKGHVLAEAQVVGTYCRRRCEED